MNMMRSLERQGVGKPLRSMEMMGWQVDPEKYYNPNPAMGGITRLSKIVGFPGILVEDITRAQAIRAMYLMGKKAGLSGDAMQDFISRNVAKTHGPSSGKLAKPPGYTFKGKSSITRILRSSIESILTFKNFAFMNYGQWGKNWRMFKKSGMIRPLAYKMGGLVGMGGTKYLMWSSSIMTLLSIIYAMFDVPEDPEEQYEKLVKSLNKAVPGLGDAIYSGLSALHFNIDLGALLAQQAPFITEDIEFREKRVFAGAGWGLVYDVLSGLVEKNPKKMVPSAIRNQIIADQYEEKGIKWGQRELLPKKEITQQDVTNKRLGFTSQKISDVYKKEQSRKFKSSQLTDIIRDEVSDKIIPMLKGGRKHTVKGEFFKLYNRVKKKDVFTANQKEKITDVKSFVSQYVMPKLEGEERELVKSWKEDMFEEKKSIRTTRGRNNRRKQSTRR